MINIVCDRCGNEVLDVKLHNIEEYQRTVVAYDSIGLLTGRTSKILCKKCCIKFDMLERQKRKELLDFLNASEVKNVGINDVYSEENEDDVSEDEEF